MVGYQGQVAQMVLEKDIAWHAGNWDYNTRAIGIEHEGFAWTPGLYTAAEYNASAQIAATICSHWGVPLDRNHVIGHDQVPDPNNPNLTGGSDHHTDPGPYWNWTYYINTAKAYAQALPSPPHMVLEADAFAGDGSATVKWQGARTCYKPLTGYQVVMQPGNVVQNLPPTATSATFTGLQNGSSYSFTVTVTNPDGDDSLVSNTVVPGAACTAARLSVSPGSPQALSALVQLSASSNGCQDPRYRFWLESPNGSTSGLRWFGSSGMTWNTSGLLAGTYKVHVWANHNTSDYSSPQAQDVVTFTLTGCTSASISPLPGKVAGGSTVPLTVSAGGCPSPEAAFWVRPSGGLWKVVQAYSSNLTFNWNTAGLPEGTYEIAARVKQHGSGTPSFEVAAGGIYTLTGCTSASINPAPGRIAGGSSVHLTVTAAGCVSPDIKFLMRPKGGVWRTVQSYGPNDTFVWNTNGVTPGTYEIAAWAKYHYSKTATYEAATGGLYTITGCTAAAVSPPPGSFPDDSTISFTASATGCTNPDFAYWMRPAGGTWKLIRDYSSNPAFSWTTTTLPPGRYEIAVWAKQHGSRVSTFEVAAGGTYTLTGCTAATLTPAPGSFTAGTTIAFTAGATGCSSPEYEFWVRPAGGTWKLVRTYSATATFSWKTTGLPRGTYEVALWARQRGSTMSYDVAAGGNYQLS